MNCERCHQPGAQPRFLTIALDGAAPSPAQFTLCRSCADLGAELEPIVGVSDFLSGALLPRCMASSTTLRARNGSDEC
jgi:hypothetical protein